MQNPISSRDRVLQLMIIGFGLWIIYSAFFGEKLPIHHGIAGDAATYFYIVTHFSALISPHQLPGYDIQRLLPLSLVIIISKITGIPANTPHHVIILFGILNTCVLYSAVAVWWLIGNKLNWTIETRIFGFSALFINYVVLKSYGYGPVATDASAFLAGLLVYYFYIADKKWCLFFTSMLSGFVYPSVIMLMGLCILLFNNHNQSVTLRKASIKLSTVFYISLITLAVIYFIFGVIAKFYSLFHPLVVSIKSNGISQVEILKTAILFQHTVFNINNAPSISLILISTIFLFFYFFFALKNYYHHFFIAITNKSVLIKFFLLLIILLMAHHFYMWYSNGHITGPHFGVSLPTFILNNIQDATEFPLAFLVAHITYFGPVICLTLFIWKDILKYTLEKNCGLYFLIGFYVLFATNSESRQSTNFFPILVIIITDLLHRKSISFRQSLIFTVICFVTSKVWLPLNHGAWPQHFTLNNMSHFPMQWVLMNVGTWLTPVSYGIDALVGLISLIFIFRIFYKTIYSPTI